MCEPSPEISRNEVVSIVIVSWNAAAKLRGCLRSIRDCLTDFDYEVIVVDNASEDGSQAMIEREFPDFLCIQTGANLGFSRGVNRGLQATTGGFVLLLNPDTALSHNAVQALRDYLDGHSDVGAVTGPILDESGDVFRALRKPPKAWSFFLTSCSLRHVIYRLPAVADRLLVTPREYRDNGEIGDIHGALFMVRRAVLDQVGGADEAFFLYLADTDLSIRIHRAGWKLGRVAEGSVTHVGAHSAQRVGVPVVVNFHLSRLRLFVKHFGASAAAGLLLLGALESMALLVVGALCSMVRARGTSKTAQRLAVSRKLARLYLAQSFRAITEGTLFDPQRIDGTQSLDMN